MSLTDIEHRDVWVRAAKTFVQAFLAVVAAGLVNVVDFTSGKALVVSAFAAGVAALWNYSKQLTPLV